ncbi:MAG: universal stress protein [Muribaculaceae bacterium]|nr:universal stress protein [Muribaculaceae bacterium]
MSRLITLAIHTYDHAIALRRLLEAEGIEVVLQNVNLEHPGVFSGVRVRIEEHNLPLALRVVENPEMFNAASAQSGRFVLVPVDFTPHSNLAARLGVKIAHRQKSDVVFLHAYIDPRMAGNGQLTDTLTFDRTDHRAVEVIKANAAARLEEFTETIKSEMRNGLLPAVRISTELLEGVPEDVINRYTRNRVPHLAVMGTRSATRKDREMIGSVTSEVLNQTRLPLLSIPEGTKNLMERQPINVLFFGSLDQEDILAMDSLNRYLKGREAKITIATMPARQRLTDKLAGKTTKALTDYCSETYKNFSFDNMVLQPKTALTQIKDAHEASPYDLFVVPTRRKNAFMRLFKPGMAHDILFSTDIPMLAIPV